MADAATVRGGFSHLYVNPARVCGCGCGFLNCLSLSVS